MKSFINSNLTPKTKQILTSLNIKTPTAIQSATLPTILSHKCLLAIAPTGTGKTLVFVIPILNDIMKTNRHYHTLVVTPTHELAKQIEHEFNRLGESVGLRFLSCIGGEDEKEQKRRLFGRQPHVVVGTPGRLCGLMRSVKVLVRVCCLVLDEVDKLVEKSYREDLNEIIESVDIKNDSCTNYEGDYNKNDNNIINNDNNYNNIDHLKDDNSDNSDGTNNNIDSTDDSTNYSVDNFKTKNNLKNSIKNQRTMNSTKNIKNSINTKINNKIKNKTNKYVLMFSATTNIDVESLINTHFTNITRTDVTGEINLKHKLLFIPHKHKQLYLYFILKENRKPIIIFMNSCLGVQTHALFLKNMGIECASLYGNLAQEKRLEMLEAFREKESGVLIATDVASRGLDIPHVEVVLNYDIPSGGKDYTHRVGRTARAGREGTAVTFVTQYDIEGLQKIERENGIKMEVHEMDREGLDSFCDKIGIVYANAYEEIKERDGCRESQKRHKRRKMTGKRSA